MYQITTKRIYDPVEKQDGFRILVDRLWPRGIKKEDAQLYNWCKEIAPSTDLRKWFHKGQKFEDFTERYLLELETKTGEVDYLKKLVVDNKVTLLYAAKSEVQNHAMVLKDYLLTIDYQDHK